MENKRKDVNGSCRERTLTAASFGRGEHVRQVSPDRQPATVGDARVQQAGSRCNNATVSQQTNKERRVATWNVRSLLRAGKVHNVAAEATRMRIDILGLSEVRWPGVGQMAVGEYEFVYSGSKEHTGV